MPEIVYPQESGEPVVVDLKDPYWAAFLAWIWPGAGHFYQKRYAKGFLFMICILSTYFFGLGIGQGRVVYASFKPGNLRWQFVCQLGVGAPALPAIFGTGKSSQVWGPILSLINIPYAFNPSKFNLRRLDTRADSYGSRANFCRQGISSDHRS